MMDHGFFDLYSPAEDSQIRALIPDALFCRHRSTGEDWYLFQAWALAEDTIKLLVDETGLICASQVDGSALFPAGFRLIEISAEGLDQDLLRGKVWSGSSVTEKLPALADYKEAFDRHLDQVALARQYDNRLTIASYISSANSQWAAEAHTFVNWRDLDALPYLFGQLAAAEGGGDVPSLEDFIAGIPAIEWPD